MNINILPTYKIYIYSYTQEHIKIKTNFYKYIFRYCYLNTLSISLDHLLIFSKEKEQWKGKEMLGSINCL